MGQITLQIPQTNQPNSTEDAKVASDLTTLQSAINGSLDYTNVSPAAAFYRFAWRSGAGSLTAALGDWVVAGPGATITLPAPVLNGVVAVSGSATVTGSNPAIVAGANIQGLGLSSASSFKLGTPQASVILESDGTNWVLVSGRQDSGWLLLTLPAGVGVSGSDSAPAVRVRGDRVEFRGSLAVTGGVGLSTLWSFPAGVPGAGAPVHIGVVSSTNLTSKILRLDAGTSAPGLVPGDSLGLGGLSYAF